MKSEDFISREAFGSSSWGRPLPKSYFYAAGIILVLAASLSLLDPGRIFSSVSRDVSSLLSTHSEPALSPLQEESPQNANPLADLSIPLADTFALNNSSAVATEAVQAEITDKFGALDNYDDTLSDAELADSDKDIDETVRKLANRIDKTKDISLSKWFEEDVQKGDTISSIFADLNIPPSTTMAILKNKKVAKQMHSLKQGEHISFLLDSDSKLVALVKPINSKKQLRFYRTSTDTDNFSYVIEPAGSHLKDTDETAPLDQFIASLDKNQAGSQDSKASDTAKEPATAASDTNKTLAAYEKRGRLVVVKINKGDTFSTAANRAGIRYTEINQILQMFKGRIQFSRNIRPGDEMRVLFTDSKGKGKISAVQFNLQNGGKIAAYRNTSNGKFYDELGMSSTKGTFRRFPLNGKILITSSFNPSRRHPVLGTVRPHNGTDFGVKIGTPVIAPADGIVDKTGYSRSSGYYVVLRHRGAYSTVYMHLSKILVKQGQRVKMGGRIAKSGNTGLSTGPHLHYELRINGRPVNAMRVKLNAPGSEISKKEKQNFASNIKKYKKDLYNSALIADVG